MRFTVAIDGPAAAGKGTIGRALAARFGFAHLDTGLLYRAVGALGGDPVAAARGLSAADLARDDLRSLAAGQAASVVAVIPKCGRRWSIFSGVSRGPRVALCWMAAILAR